MKTLFKKQSVFLYAAAMLCAFTVNAQLINHLPNSFHKDIFMKTMQYNYKGKGSHRHDPACEKNSFCLRKQITLGGTRDDSGQNIIPANDGGFAVCGITGSNNGDFHATDTINGDAFVAKYNKFKQLEWTKTYGGTGNDGFNNLVQTYDGGYIVVGYTNSNDGDVSGNRGNYDVWVVKLSSSGKLQWQKCYGGTGDESGSSIVKTFYGGYAIASGTNSNDGDVSGDHNTDGNTDAWFIQINAKGKLLFQHCYGGTDFDDFDGIIRSDSRGFIVMGNTGSNDDDVSGNHGNGDVWVVKLNAFGKISWETTVGGSNVDYIFINSIAKTTDGNVVIDGFSNSVDGDINASNDTSNSFITKLNANTGKIIWSKSYAEPFQRAGFGIFATRDGGTVETGSGGGNDVDAFNVLITKYDKHGNEEWYKQLGGSDFDLAIAGYETLDGDLNIVAQTSSTDGDIKKYDGNNDTWLLLLGPCGNYIAEDATKTNSVIAATKNSATNLSAYPNPVTNAATISFNLSQTQNVLISIYDMNGRLIKTLADAQTQSGPHQLIWNARDEKGYAVGAGMYILKLQAGSYSETKMISIIK